MFTIQITKILIVLVKITSNVPQLKHASSFEFTTKRFRLMLTHVLRFYTRVNQKHRICVKLSRKLF